MDYEFEAPQYVNFANAMDEDDHDVSKYFDVEHEHNLRKAGVKFDPLDILPKGARTFDTPSKPNRASSLKSRQSSEQTVVPVQQQAKRDPSRKHPVSRLGAVGKLGSEGTPLKSHSAQYADCLTPGVKRLRSSTDNTPEGTPSKRLKSTPGVVIKALANIQLSPASVSVDSLLKDAVETLDHVSRSAKKPKTPSIRRLSVVDGINVDLKQEKDHQMETRADKQQRQTPLHLRSRSVPRSQQSRSQAASPSKFKLEMKSRTRARSVSKDRGITAAKSKNEADRFVSLSDVLNKNPSRFKFKKNSPSKLANGPMKPLRPTVPYTTDAETRFRNKSSVETSTTNRTVSKLNGTLHNTLKPSNSIEKRTPTVPAPFKLTEVRKKEVTPAAPFKFVARPVPKSVLEPTNKGVTPNKDKTLTKAQTPHKNIMNVLEESNGQRTLKEKDWTYLDGVKFVSKKQVTEPKPFSFEVRENERLARKTARLQEKIEAETRGRAQFHANPLPVFTTPRNLKRSPSPFSRKPSAVAVNGIAGNHVEKSTKESAAPPVKASLGPNFRARAPVVLAKKPFEPIKPQRQLPLPAVTLNSEMRAKERQEYDKKQAEKDLELQALAKRRKEEQERREQEARAKLRKEIVHKARPIPDLKTFETQPSDKPLTDPKTPYCLKRSVASAH